METLGDKEKKERREKADSDGREKVFWVQRFWVCGLSL